MDKFCCLSSLSEAFLHGREVWNSRVIEIEKIWKLRRFEKKVEMTEENRLFKGMHCQCKTVILKANDNPLLCHIALPLYGYF